MQTNMTRAVACGALAAALMIVTGGCDHLRSGHASATTTEKKAPVSESVLPASDRYKTGGDPSQ
jgi:hypothetical protein